MKYSGTSLMLSQTGLGKSDLNGEVNYMGPTSYSLYYGIQFARVTIMVRWPY